jgi:7,8-dihydropterin-6-yl-methyl-4-(beta-D-ribofuranosyl)aminobenzene 5'-phosphate synthase
MKLTVLTDNNTIIDHYYLAEPALSFLIEDRDCRILFDCGYSDVFLQNAWRAGIDMLFLDYVAFSHGHLDHTWGMLALIRLFNEAKLSNRPFRKPTVVAHPRTFVSVIDPEAGEIGSLLSREKIDPHFMVNTSTAPVKLTSRLSWLGEIPRRMPFEAQTTIGAKTDDEQPDFMPDDTALAYTTEKGLVIITGCAHAGICNIICHAREVTGVEKVVDIIGGLHLQAASETQLAGTINFLKSVGLKQLHACHCTDLAARTALSATLPVQEVGAGLRVAYE